MKEDDSPQRNFAIWFLFTCVRMGSGLPSGLEPRW